LDLLYLSDCYIERTKRMAELSGQAELLVDHPG